MAGGADADRWLVVGLGNPGSRYAGNRHNVGAMAVERLATVAGVSLSRTKFRARYGTGDLEGRPVVLLVPETFMNLSGQAVSPARSFFGIPPSQILVVHDELDLAYATLRLKSGGGHAGHNGLRSIIAELGAPDFARLRVGIGRPVKPANQEIADFVLQDFGPDERVGLDELLVRSVAACRLALKDGVDRAMNTINSAS